MVTLDRWSVYSLSKVSSHTSPSWAWFSKYLNRGQHVSTSYTPILADSDLCIDHIALEYDHLDFLEQIKAIEKEIKTYSSQ